MNLDLAGGIFAFMLAYAYPVIGCTWAYGRLLRITWRDVNRALAARDRKRRRLAAL